MFVFPHKIVLKTCGTTTLLKAVPYVLEIAKTRCGYESVYRLFYSRKSFMFPDKQPGPHRSWEEEVQYLDSHFGKFILICSMVFIHLMKSIRQRCILCNW
jgi:S-adenosylmethionine decarboxylase